MLPEIASCAQTNDWNTGCDCMIKSLIEHPSIIYRIDAMNDQISVTQNCLSYLKLRRVIDSLIYARRINPSHNQTAQIHRHTHMIPCCARDIRNQRYLLTDERIDQ